MNHVRYESVSCSPSRDNSSDPHGKHESDSFCGNVIYGAGSRWVYTFKQAYRLVVGYLVTVSSSRGTLTSNISPTVVHYTHFKFPHLPNLL